MSTIWRETGLSPHTECCTDLSLTYSTLNTFKVIHTFMWEELMQCAVPEQALVMQLVAVFHQARDQACLVMVLL